MKAGQKIAVVLFVPVIQKMQTVNQEYPTQYIYNSYSFLVKLYFLNFQVLFT